MVSLSPSRSQDSVALTPPTKQRLENFPQYALKASKALFRAHRRANGPWWFSSDGSGRFDLTGSAGTCYLADAAAAALREALGESLVTAGIVEFAELDVRVVSTLTVSKQLSLADATAAKAANHGITKEISTATYPLTQAWARAWADRGMHGVRYAGRFSTAHEDRCYALFGPSGASSAVVDPAPQPATQVAIAAGIRVVNRPRSVTIVAPPSP